MIRYSVTVAEYFHVLSYSTLGDKFKAKDIPSEYHLFHFGRTRKYYLLDIFLKIYLNIILNHSTNWQKNSMSTLRGTFPPTIRGRWYFQESHDSCHVHVWKGLCVMGLYQMGLVYPFSKCSGLLNVRRLFFLWVKLGFFFFQTWIFRLNGNFIKYLCSTLLNYTKPDSMSLEYRKKVNYSSVLTWTFSVSEKKKKSIKTDLTWCHLCTSDLKFSSPFPHPAESTLCFLYTC